MEPLGRAVGVGYPRLPGQVVGERHEVVHFVAGVDGLGDPYRDLVLIAVRGRVAGEMQALWPDRHQDRRPSTQTGARWSVDQADPACTGLRAGTPVLVKIGRAHV